MIITKFSFVRWPQYFVKVDLESKILFPAIMIHLAFERKRISGRRILPP